MKLWRTAGLHCVWLGVFLNLPTTVAAAGCFAACCRKKALRKALPTRHLIKNTWYHKAGVGKAWTTRGKKWFQKRGVNKWWIWCRNLTFPLLCCSFFWAHCVFLRFYKTLVKRLSVGPKHPWNFRWIFLGASWKVDRLVCPKTCRKMSNLMRLKDTKKPCTCCKGIAIPSSTSWGSSHPFFFTKNEMSRHLGGKCVKMVESLKS